MDVINSWFRRFYPEKLDREMFEYDPWLGGMWRYTGREDRVFPRIVCRDGFSMSVQGHAGAYSLPRDDFADKYVAVEVLCPAQKELDEHKSGEQLDGEFLYARVPVWLVEAVIANHGGIDEDASFRLMAEIQACATSPTDPTAPAEG
jgi:hypothetical protein